MDLQQFINKINPRKLFLVDGLGALFSALMLVVVLANFENTFGMPRPILHKLALVAVLFSIYSLTCFFTTANKWRPLMKIIAIANLLYCCATLAYVIFLIEKLTALGIIYFIAEIIIVVILALIELKTASNTPPFETFEAHVEKLP